MGLNLRSGILLIGVLLLAAGIAYATTQIQRDDIGASFVIGQVQTAEDTIVLYSQIGPPNTADFTELKFGTGDVD